MRAASILQPDAPYRSGDRFAYPDPSRYWASCFVTGRTYELDVHHIFHGPYRSKSDELGCWVYLSHEVHMALHDHREPYADLDAYLKQTCQQAMEDAGWSREDFIKTFGRSYI